jgi:hypothetical protein
MERLIDAWDNPGRWQGNAAAIGDPQFYPPYRVKRHASTALRGECRFTFPTPVPCLDFFSFSLQGDITLAVDGVAYSVPHTKHFARVHFPAPPYITEIRITTAYAIVSDLRTWREDFPADILDNLCAELQALMPRIPCGELAAEAGTRDATLATEADFLTQHAVIAFNGEVHEISNIREDVLEFYSTFDGETIRNDFSGGFEIIPVVQKGFYSREIALPGVTLWYDAPRPNDITAGFAQRRFQIGDLYFAEREGKNYTWDITLEIASHSPEVIQRIAAVVRAYLAENSVWIHGLKTIFVFQDAALNDEPVEEHDTLPRVIYKITIDIEEQNEWHKENMGMAKAAVSIR